MQQLGTYAAEVGAADELVPTISVHQALSLAPMQQEAILAARTEADLGLLDTGSDELLLPAAALIAPGLKVSSTRLVALRLTKH